MTLEDLSRAQLTEDELQTALLQKLVDSMAAPTAASRLATDPREIARGILMGATEATDKSVGNQRAGIESVNRALEKNSSALINLMSGEGSFAELAQTVSETTEGVAQGFGRITDIFTNTNWGESIEKYTSSGNIIYDASVKIYYAVSSVTEKIQNYSVDIVQPQLEKLEKAATKTVVEFADIKYQGNLNVTLTTPTGTPQSVVVTDQMAYDLFKNPTFQKQTQMVIQQALSQNNYAALPNTA